MKRKNKNKIKTNICSGCQFVRLPLSSKTLAIDSLAPCIIWYHLFGVGYIYGEWKEGAGVNFSLVFHVLVMCIFLSCWMWPLSSSKASQESTFHLRIGPSSSVDASSLASPSFSSIFLLALYPIVISSIFFLWHSLGYRIPEKEITSWEKQR